MDDLIRRQAEYTFGNDEFSLEAAYHGCKLVFDGITDDDSFQKADTGVILYYANEIIYALHEVLQGKDANVHTKDCISRQAAIDELDKGTWGVEWDKALAKAMIDSLPSVQPDHIADGSTKVGMESKYEYHYDHTDCIWYRPEARNRCPSTCAQYRDGWNDAMNYIFRDGEGYMPYRRDKQYGE